MLLLTYVSRIQLPFPHAAMASPAYAKYLPEGARPRWLDSGGFLALKRGAPPPPAKELCRLCEELGAEVCFAPDVPPPPDSDSLGYFRMEDRNVKAAEAAPCPLAPVVHVHPSSAYDAALRMAVRAARALGAPLVGVGGAVPHIAVHRHSLVRRCALAALQAAGRAHLFGAGSPTSLRALSLPPEKMSADWAGWTLKASYGKVVLPPEADPRGRGGERHVTGRRLHKRYPTLSGEEAEALLRWLAARGYPDLPPLEEFVERLRASHTYRAQINAFVALKWYEEKRGS
ncbi:MAG: hypothetical protein RXR06_10015 [Thermoproteus sp.]